MTVLAMTDPAPRAQHHVDARRRGHGGCGQKRAFARRGFCRDRRRPVLPGKPQVGSGVRPGSPRRIVGVSCFYDPSTGNFLSRDPITPLTRSPYGYVYGNPLNNTDPTGLWAWDGLCVMGVNCGEDATYAVASPQDAADFSGGVLNGLTLGHGAGITEALPFTRGKVNYDSGWATGGTVVGTVPWVVGSVGSSPAWAGASKATTGISITGRATMASAGINVWNACHTAGWTSDCAWSALTNAGTGALGAWGAIGTAAGASLFSLFANYLDPAAVRDFLLSRASADELC